MLRNFSIRQWWRTRKAVKKSSKPMFPRRKPEFEQLEIRWMPSAVTLGLLTRQGEWVSRYSAI
jgi:hypothetical protein